MKTLNILFPLKNSLRNHYPRVFFKIDSLHWASYQRSWNTDSTELIPTHSWFWRLIESMAHFVTERTREKVLRRAINSWLTSSWFINDEWINRIKTWSDSSHSSWISHIVISTKDRINSPIPRPNHHDRSTHSVPYFDEKGWYPYIPPSSLVQTLHFLKSLQPKVGDTFNISLLKPDRISRGNTLYFEITSIEGNYYFGNAFTSFVESSFRGQLVVTEGKVTFIKNSRISSPQSPVLSLEKMPRAFLYSHPVSSKPITQYQNGLKRSSDRSWNDSFYHVQKYKI